MNFVINPPYKFQRGEPGIFVEIYLPKKASFQGTLYDTLVNGFEVQKVINHFKTREKAEGIKDLLERYRDSVEFLNNESDIDAFPQVLHGYTMYEVEGVYYKSSKQRIQSELTQVVRIMFKPDLSQLALTYPGDENAKGINRTAKDYLRYPEGRDKFKRTRTLSPMQIEVVDYLEKWANYVGLFLFGFIIYEICEQITRLCAQGKMQWDDAEDEIWVTSFWNLVINPIRLVKIESSVRETL